MNGSNLRFGAKAPGQADTHNGYTLAVEWSEKFETSLEAAETAIKKYGLLESDFWINKIISGSNIVYKGLILSYAGCLKINEKLKAADKFDPTCVEQGYGPDGGVLFVYRSKEQNVFVTGEASRFNLGGLAYPGATAEKRVFCRFVARKTGLYAEGVYTEVESDEFKAEKPAVETGAPPVAPFLKEEAPVSAMPEPVAVVQNTVPQVEVAPTEPAVEKGRLKDLMSAIIETGTDLDRVLAAYHAEDLTEISEKGIEEIEGIIYKRLADKRANDAAAAAQAPAPQAPVQTQPKAESVSPIAAMLVGNAKQNQVEDAPAEEAPVAEAEAVEVSSEEPAEALGETVYACIDGSPTNFQGLAGKTLDEIGKEMLKALHGRSNSRGRKWVTKEMQAKIDQYLAA